MRTRTRSRRLESKRSATLLENLEPRLLLSATSFIQVGTLRFELLAYSNQTQQNSSLPDIPSAHDDMPSVTAPTPTDLPDLPTVSHASTTAPTTFGGHPVAQITWEGQAYYVLADQYTVKIADGTDVSTLAARTGLDITGVQDFGNGRFRFNVQNATPDQMDAWGKALGDTLAYIEPVVIYTNGIDTTVVPPMTFSGQPVDPITWNGQKMYVVDNQYEAMVNDQQAATITTAEDFTAYAASSGLTVTDVTVLPGPGRFQFMAVGATPEQVAAWGTQVADTLQYVEPNSVILNPWNVPATTHKTFDGHPVTQVAWKGQWIDVVENRYSTKLNDQQAATITTAEDFTAFAASRGLTVTDVQVVPANGGFNFTVQGATPNQVATWAAQVADAVEFVEPSSVIFDYPWETPSEVLPILAPTTPPAAGATAFIRMGTLRVELPGAR